MKRMIVLLACIFGLCVMVTACGKVKPETELELSRLDIPIEEPVEGEPVDIHLVTIATDELIQPIEFGKTMLADLDGDGVWEKITVRSDSNDDVHNQKEIHFQVNDLYYHDSDFVKLVPWGAFNVYGNEFYLVDLDTSDRFKEIVILDYTGIDDRGYFIRYHQGEMIPISGNMIDGISLSGENVSICGDGTVKKPENFYFSAGRMETFERTWKLIDSNQFHTALEDVTEFYEFRLHPDEEKLTLIQEMTFYAGMDSNPDRLLTLPAGTKIDIARVYLDTGWIQIRYDGETKEAWMKLIGNQVYLPMNIYNSSIESYITGFSNAD